MSASVHHRNKAHSNLAQSTEVTMKSNDNLYSLLNDGVNDNNNTHTGEANHVTSDDLSQLAQKKVLDELNSLYEEYTFATAKDASLTDDLQRRILSRTNVDKNELHHTEDSLVYGEIDLEGFCDLL